MEMIQAHHIESMGRAAKTESNWQEE